MPVMVRSLIICWNISSTILTIQKTFSFVGKFNDDNATGAYSFDTILFDVGATPGDSSDNALLTVTFSNGLQLFDYLPNFAADP